MTHTSSTVPLIHTETEAGERVRSMFFRYLYAHSSRYFFTNRWFRLLIQLFHHHIVPDNRLHALKDDDQALAACIHSGQLAAPAPSTTYPLAGVVVTVDRAADLVTFRTGSGHLYSLTGCDDWLPGDVIACTMDDNGTPHDVTDDTITQYRYCGYVS